MYDNNFIFGYCRGAGASKLSFNNGTQIDTNFACNKIYHLWLNQLCRTDKITLVCAVFIIYHDDNFALAQIR